MHKNAVRATRAAWPLTRPPVGRTSGKAGGRPYHPQAHRVVASAGRADVAKRRAREDLDIGPGPATHHPAGAGWTGSFATICSVVGIRGIQTAGPVPGIARHVYQSCGRLATRENANGRRAADVCLKRIATCCIKVVAKGIATALSTPQDIAPALSTTRCSFPLHLGRQPERLPVCALSQAQ